MSEQTASNAPDIKAFFDHDSNTVSDLVANPATKKAATIDSVLDFDYASVTICYDHADQIFAYVVAQ